MQFPCPRYAVSTGPAAAHPGGPDPPSSGKAAHQASAPREGIWGVRMRRGTTGPGEVPRVRAPQGAEARRGAAKLPGPLLLGTSACKCLCLTTLRLMISARLIHFLVCAGLFKQVSKISSSVCCQRCSHKSQVVKTQHTVTSSQCWFDVGANGVHQKRFPLLFC